MNVTIIDHFDQSTGSVGASRRGFLKAVREFRRMLRQEWPSAWTAVQAGFSYEDDHIYHKARVKNFIVTVETSAESWGIQFAGQGGCAPHLSLKLPCDGTRPAADPLTTAFELLDIGEELALQAAGTPAGVHEELAHIVAHALMSVNGKVTVRAPTPWTKGKILARTRIAKHGLDRALWADGPIPSIDGTVDVKAEIAERIKHLTVLVRPEMSPTIKCMWSSHSGGGHRLVVNVVEAWHEGQARLGPMDALRAFGRWQPALTTAGLA
jgi:hypothetical protein